MYSKSLRFSFPCEWHALVVELERRQNTSRSISCHSKTTSIAEMMVIMSYCIHGCLVLIFYNENDVIALSLYFTIRF